VRPGGRPADTICRARGALQPQEKISLEDCIRAYTSGSACARFEEGKKGKLKTGEYKDSPIKLSDGDKLILMMLSEIHEHLKIENGDDSKFVQSTILSGNLWGHCGIGLIGSKRGAREPVAPLSRVENPIGLEGVLQFELEQPSRNHGLRDLAEVGPGRAQVQASRAGRD
jgi:hypothetical protein